MTFCLNHNIIDNCQYGFLPGKFTITQLLECMNSWTQVYETNSTVRFIYFDGSLILTISF